MHSLRLRLFFHVRPLFQSGPDKRALNEPQTRMKGVICAPDCFIVSLNTVMSYLDAKFVDGWMDGCGPERELPSCRGSRQTSSRWRTEPQCVLVVRDRHSLPGPPAAPPAERGGAVKLCRPDSDLSSSKKELKGGEVLHARSL